MRETALDSGTYANLMPPKNVGAGNPNIAILGTPNFGGATYVTFYPRGTSTVGSLTLIHNLRLSKATISTNLMGRVNVTYELK
jgi:hypothetical protein